MTILRAAILVIAGMALLAQVSEASRLEEIESALDVSEEASEYIKYESELSGMAAEKAGSDRADVLCQLARARYLLGETESFGDDERIAYLDGAIASADEAMSVNPSGNRPLYWKSMSLLMKADVDGGISSLGMVKDALKGFEAVQKTDPAYDAAGAYRSHGKVLIEMPSWTFMKDTEAAIEMLEKAVELAPDSLLNRLYLAQAYLEDDRLDEAYAMVEYIMDAPVNTMRPKEDKDIREEAGTLRSELEKR